MNPFSLKSCGARWLLVLLLLMAPVFAAKPRVFVYTDINIDAGDPDDRQSLVHLLWYADELEITGIVPDRWEARGREACELAVAAYAKDWRDFNLAAVGYPYPEYIASLMAADREAAEANLIRAARASDEPLWVLVWGNMANIARTLQAHPELALRIRLVTIGTGLMYEPDREFLPPDWERLEPCRQRNWNGAGRNEVYHDSRFDEMWWLEINWTYNGMFSGDEPTQMFEKLKSFGAMGRHFEEVTENEPWARYFRVGDTPSVLYVIDPRGQQDDPTRSSWAGRFRRAQPKQRPHYFTDERGPVEWDYADPCATWENHAAVYAYSKGTLEQERPAMYQALLDKLQRLYQPNTDPAQKEK